MLQIRNCHNQMPQYECSETAREQREQRIAKARPPELRQRTLRSIRLLVFHGREQRKETHRKVEHALGDVPGVAGPALPSREAPSSRERGGRSVARIIGMRYPSEGHQPSASGIVDVQTRFVIELEGMPVEHHACSIVCRVHMNLNGVLEQWILVREKFHPGGCRSRLWKTARFGSENADSIGVLTGHICAMPRRGILSPHGRAP